MNLQIHLVRLLSSESRYIHFFDARPIVNAMGNAFAGAGYEVAESYHPCKISFLKIENIHVMRHIMKGMLRDYYSSDQSDNVDGMNIF